MKHFTTKALILILCLPFLSTLTSCEKIKRLISKPKSSSTGWEYNSQKNGGFEYKNGYNQATGPGLVFIPGGTFVMGQTMEDVMGDWNNSPKRVTVASFYMDETEVKNINYLEYLHWLRKIFKSNPSVYEKALPDTLVWRTQLAYNEPMVRNYLRFKAYAEYPVVGVSWEQASDFCQWRTDRVNEKILVDKGILKYDINNQSGSNNFNTDAYLTGLYTGTVKKNLKTLDGVERGAKWTDGILLPSYRLPTEAEWEYAALGLIGNTEDERINNKRTFPWNGSWVRNSAFKNRGQFMANFIRGKGDYMGIAGYQNDGGVFPMPVKSFLPNDFGLYCMAGNVNEWVADVYRQIIDNNEYNPFRGNVFKRLVKDSLGKPVKDSLGKLKYQNQTQKELEGRKNYRTADNKNYNDGDLKSRIKTNSWKSKDTAGSQDMYINKNNEITSLISDIARVYKGGSWKDRVYWLSPGTRRFLNQKMSTDDIGFRCAMSHVGSSGKTNK